MPWIALEASGEEFTFIPIASDGGVVSLTDSVALQDQGDPPSGVASAAWRLRFGAEGSARPDLHIRLVPVSFVMDPSNPNPYPISVGHIEDESTYIADELAENEAGDPTSEWLPNPAGDWLLNFGDGTDKFVAFYLTGDANASTSQFLVEVWQEGPEPITTSYNCTCDDDTARRTLKSLRDDMMRRLGWGAQVNAPPPGVADMLNSFLIEAQELLYRRYQVLRTERFFSWPLVQDVRLYDLPENAETCTKKLDPRSLTWVGVERDSIWYPLVCGIPPELYSYDQTGRPQRYEIRQCIEVWPKPEATEGNLVIKGHFGIEPFAADTDKVTIDDRAVFLMALANAKAHYRQPDAGNYVQQLEVYIDNLVAGAHNTRRYIPGRDDRFDYVYTQPRPLVPFS